MFNHSPQPFKHWTRHTASVPKGFLRYCVLKLLKEKPMSGSEIMEEIEKETDGRWKPSPGSIYPLLAWLQDNGYTKEKPTEESGIKRYTLTEQGEKFFEKQVKLKEKLQQKLEFLAPAFLFTFAGNILMHPGYKYLDDYPLVQAVGMFLLHSQVESRESLRHLRLGPVSC